MIPHNQPKLGAKELKNVKDVIINNNLSNKNKTKFIEDCSHSFGSSVNEKFLGLSEDVGITSFYTTKLITTGGHGGIIFSKNIKLIKKIRKFLDYDNHKKNGFNLNMSDISAAISLAQLGKLNKFKKNVKTFLNYIKNFQ